MLLILPSIDWESIGNKFPYRVRQAAGDSALGNYKFNMAKF
ncbi:Putative murein L,D-transpeptidase [Haemophilus influenzae]|uniref:Murein L,D-transpeptidase n=1 Tax=Haemophilus influenzae TaxID=727 RepID=A0A2X1PTK4_HAEIF|nr:Putative murein L,D-transpeptidase [Haemophilus influenzae]